MVNTISVGAVTDDIQMMNPNVCLSNVRRNYIQKWLETKMLNSSVIMIIINVKASASNKVLDIGNSVICQMSSLTSNLWLSGISLSMLSSNMICATNISARGIWENLLADGTKPLLEPM